MIDANNIWEVIQSLGLVCAGGFALFRLNKANLHLIEKRAKEEHDLLDKKLSATRTTLFNLERDYRDLKKDVEHHEKECTNRRTEVNEDFAEIKSDVKEIKSAMEDIRVTFLSFANNKE